MCAELKVADPTLALDGRGVNGAGHESGNAAVCAGRTLAWLQDDGASDVWGLWTVTQRDCIVLDTFGRVHAIYNLTSHDLNNPTYYAELKALILAAWSAPP